VELRSLIGAQLIGAHDDLDLSTVRQVRGSVEHESPVLHLDLESLHTTTLPHLARA
jgi:hypothetical protein